MFDGDITMDSVISTDQGIIACTTKMESASSFNQ